MIVSSAYGRFGYAATIPPEPSLIVTYPLIDFAGHETELRDRKDIRKRKRKRRSKLNTLPSRDRDRAIEARFDGSITITRWKRVQF